MSFVNTQAHSFDDLVNLWQLKPSWAEWDPHAVCVADRNSNSYAEGLTVEKACTMTEFNCANIPWDCKGDAWKTADYVLSTYYFLVRGNPLEKCYFDGAAKFTRSDESRAQDATCVVTSDPQTTPLTEQGFQAVITQKDYKKTETFFKRYIKRGMQASIVDQSQLKEFAEKPPTSMYEVKRLLADALWICGGSTHRHCSLWTSSAGAELWWWKYAFAGLGLLV